MDSKSACGEAQMLIRKDAATIFNPFIDSPETKNFWFTKGSGNLEIDKEVTWTWEMYSFRHR